MKLKAALAGAILSLAFAAGTAQAAPVVSADAARSVAADASASPVTQVHFRHRHRFHRHRWHGHRWHRHRWHRRHWHGGYGRHCRWKRKCGYYGCRIVRRCHRHW